MAIIKCKICGTGVNVADGAATAICHVCGNTVVAEGAVQQTNTAVAPLLQRVFLFLEDGIWASANEYCERILDIEPQNAYAYFCKLMIDQKVRQREGLQNCLEPFDGNGNYQKALRFGDEALQAELKGYIEHIKSRNENNRKEGIYKFATNTMEQAKATGVLQKYTEAAAKFKEIGDYKDAAAKAVECEELSESTRKDRLLAGARMQLQSDQATDWETARKTLTTLPGWRDADELVKQCESKIAAFNEQMRIAYQQRQKQAEAVRLQQQAAEEERRKQEEELERQRQQLQAEKEEAMRQKKEKRRKKKPLIIVIAIVLVLALLGAGVWFWLIPTINYNKAEDLMTAGKYSEAITEFEKLKGFQDSQDQIAKCNAAIVNQKYEAAVALMEEGKYAEAKAAFEALGDYKDSADQIKKCEAKIAEQKLAADYDKAVAMMEEGKYAEAAAIFEALGDFRDSADKLKECNLEIQYSDAVALLDAGKTVEAYEALKALGNYKDSAEKAASIYEQYQVGDYVYFGCYEQDNNTSNGKEDIEWLVLDIQDGKALVVSKYALDCKQYNTSKTDVTWESCSLRTWLNDDFINAAFSAEEQAMIPTVTVPAHKNPNYSTDPGNDTQDRVFLLSIKEVNTYFGTDSARVCQPTAYAVANGAYKSSSGSCWWWLRSPGLNQDYAARVLSGGGVDGGGNTVRLDHGAVRPAMWITIDE